MVVDLEPPLQPIQTLIYLCDNRFHTEYLDGLFFENGENTYGFIVMDGNGTLFGRVKGNCKVVLHEISVELPNKHRRGGQSALRFSRLRDEARHNYIRKVAEASSKLFLDKSEMCNVKGLVMAGSAELKNELVKCKLLDQRLAKVIVSQVTLAYGGRRGFDEAIDRTVEALGNVELMEETNLLQSYFDQIGRDAELCCYGVAETIAALDMGAVENLIVWEDLDTNVAVNRDSGCFIGVVTDTENAEIAVVPLVGWLCDHYTEHGCSLHLVSGSSSLGMQFARAFGGVGGLLRFRIPSPLPAGDGDGDGDGDGVYDFEEDESASGGSCEYDFDEGDFAF